jgi:hypothetical protein
MCWSAKKEEKLVVAVRSEVKGADAESPSLRLKGGSEP